MLLLPSLLSLVLIPSATKQCCHIPRFKRQFGIAPIASAPPSEASRGTKVVPSSLVQAFCHSCTLHSHSLTLSSASSYCPRPLGKVGQATIHEHPDAADLDHPPHLGKVGQATIHEHPDAADLDHPPHRPSCSTRPLPPDRLLLLSDQLLPSAATKSSAPLSPGLATDGAWHLTKTPTSHLNAQMNQRHKLLMLAPGAFIRLPLSSSSSTSNHLHLWDSVASSQLPLPSPPLDFHRHNCLGGFLISSYCLLIFYWFSTSIFLS